MQAGTERTEKSGACGPKEKQSVSAAELADPVALAQRGMAMTILAPR
jgi:hypothetical protein